jgi:hypothetical protein
LMNSLLVTIWSFLARMICAAFESVRMCSSIRAT